MFIWLLVPRAGSLPFYFKGFHAVTAPQDTSEASPSTWPLSEATLELLDDLRARHERNLQVVSYPGHFSRTFTVSHSGLLSRGHIICPIFLSSFSNYVCTDATGNPLSKRTIYAVRPIVCLLPRRLLHCSKRSTLHSQSFCKKKKRRRKKKREKKKRKERRRKKKAILDARIYLRSNLINHRPSNGQENFNGMSNQKHRKPNLRQ